MRRCSHLVNWSVCPSVEIASAEGTSDGSRGWAGAPAEEPKYSCRKISLSYISCPELTSTANATRKTTHCSPWPKKIQRRLDQKCFQVIQSSVSIATQIQSAPGIYVWLIKRPDGLDFHIFLFYWKSQQRKEMRWLRNRRHEETSHLTGSLHTLGSVFELSQQILGKKIQQKTKTNPNDVRFNYIKPVKSWRFSSVAQTLTHSLDFILMPSTFLLHCYLKLLHCAGEVDVFRGCLILERGHQRRGWKTQQARERITKDAEFYLRFQWNGIKRLVDSVEVRVLSGQAALFRLTHRSRAIKKDVNARQSCTLTWCWRRQETSVTRGGQLPMLKEDGGRR